jgi:hypothetical protein
MIIFTPNTVIRSTDVNSNFSELKTKTDYLSAPDSAWIAPTFTNSWVNFGNPWAAVGYRKDAEGYVWLRGLMKDGTINLPCFTLPVGYRPPTNGGLRFACVANNLFAALTITDDGKVTPETGSNFYYFLDGARFKAEA